MSLESTTSLDSTSKTGHDDMSLDQNMLVPTSDLRLDTNDSMTADNNMPDGQETGNSGDAPKTPFADDYSDTEDEDAIESERAQEKGRAEEDARLKGKASDAFTIEEGESGLTAIDLGYVSDSGGGDDGEGKGGTEDVGDSDGTKVRKNRTIWCCCSTNSADRRVRRCSRNKYCLESWYLLKLAWPIATSAFLNNMGMMLSTAFVGHIGEKELAAMSLGALVANLTGYALIYGMMSAMDSLCAASFGARSFKRLGTIAQRAYMIGMIMAVGISIVWWNASALLRACGIESDTAFMSGEYLHISVFSLPFVIINTVMSKYLSAQGITRPSLYATSICVVLTVPLNYVFIYETPLGYRGAAVSYVLNNGTNTIVLLTYLFATTAHRRCWDGLKIKEVVTDWQSIKEFLKLGLPSLGMMWAEWGGLEIHALLAGWLGTAYLGAQALLMNLLFMMFMLPMGVGIASNARTGRYLGANRPSRATRTMRTTLLIVFITQSITLGTVAGVRNHIGTLFTNAPNVLTIVVKVIPMFILLSFFDGVQGSVAGIIRALRYQHIGLILNVIGYWIISLPLGYALAFHVGEHQVYPDDDHVPVDPTSKESGLGLEGQWLGLMCSSALVAFSYIALLYKTDWRLKAKEISDREAKLKEEQARKEAGEGNGDSEGGDVNGQQIDGSSHNTENGVVAETKESENTGKSKKDDRAALVLTPTEDYGSGS